MIIGRQNGTVRCVSERAGDVGGCFDLWVSGGVAWIAALSHVRLIVANDKGCVCVISVSDEFELCLVKKWQLKQGVVCGCVVSENVFWLASKNSIFEVTIPDHAFNVVTIDRYGFGIRAMAYVGGTEVWAVGESELRIYTHGKPRRKFPLSASFSVAVMHLGGARTVWIGQIDMVVVWSLKWRQVALIHLPGSGKVTSIAQSAPTDTVWIATDSGLCEYRLAVQI